VYISDLTSRGALEENWCLVKHLLHAEGHAEECIANAARAGKKSEVERLGLLLDKVRRERQALVSLIFGSAEAKRSSRSEPSPCVRCKGDLGSCGACPGCEIAMSV